MRYLVSVSEGPHTQGEDIDGALYRKCFHLPLPRVRMDTFMALAVVSAEKRQLLTHCLGANLRAPSENT